MITTERLMPADEALDLVLRHVQRLPVEQVPLEQAGDRILAEPLIADRDLPPFHAATMDGFAVIAEDPSPRREIVGDQFAGMITGIEVRPGTAVRVTTGAPLPAGANAVVQVEKTDLIDNQVVIRQDIVARDQFIRRIGSDVRAGDVLIESGSPIGPAELGLLAGLGRASVPVFQRPRLSVLSTGNELVDPEQQPGPAKIRDSNSYSLALAATRAGAQIIWSGRAPDDAGLLRALLAERANASDMVLTSGGVSMGERDLVKGLLAELGTVHFRKLFVKPGKPVHFATIGSTPVFGLPGNPVSALVMFEIFVHTALKLMAGWNDPRPRTVMAILEEAIISGDRPEYQRGIIWADESGQLHARNTGAQSSARLLSFVTANALIMIHPGRTVYRPGERVEAIMIGPIANASDPLPTAPESHGP